MDPWLASWIVVHLGLQALGVIYFMRNRNTLRTREVVKWVLLLLFVPIVGVIGYLFFLLENAVKRGTPGRRDRAAPFLQSARSTDHRR
ncbi:MAG: hypothetical protein QNJ88_16150 [Acidimicrobiia bacterium]|nr:hypothetical protein [Acidimicrobiia bacterium]